MQLSKIPAKLPDENVSSKIVVQFFLKKWKKSNHAGLLALLILLAKIGLAQVKPKD